MKGDFTRFTHDPQKHYSGVLQQQGRVSVDADWNEFVYIQDYLRRTGTRDIVGRCGVPYSTKDGFRISRSSDNSSLVLERGDASPARIYVDGIMCEQEKGITLNDNPEGDGTYLIYLDAWQRHVTAVEDKGIAEVALGGPDTGTRIKTEWQVRFKDISADTATKDFYLKRFSGCMNEAWSPDEYAGTGKMAAQARPGDLDESLCDVGARGGYRGLENRLYRVEIHSGGELGTDPVTFKWSRDNGSVLFPIREIEYEAGKSTVALRETGKDDFLTLHIGDWVEITDDSDELALRTGILAQVAAGSDMSKGVVVVETDVSTYGTSEHAKIRRWDQKDTSEVVLTGGTITVTADAWIPLEDGVEVCFKSGTYEVGDYWLIPARTRLRDVLWDRSGDAAVYQPRHGTVHHYCLLAIAEFDGGVWREPTDLRCIFPPLNELKRTCCILVHPGEDIQRVINGAVFSAGGCIRLCKGVHHVTGPLKLDNSHDLTICGDNCATVIHFEGTNDQLEGGFVLNGCVGVSIEDMVIVGDNTPALFTIKGSEEARVNHDIRLANLTVFNRSIERGGRTGFNCAIRLGHSRDITIENCRMTAESGIISLFGDSLPDPGLLTNLETARKFRLTHLGERTNESGIATGELNYGIGVHKLQMRNSMILFRNFGIWALKSVGWSLENCSLFVVPATGETWPKSLSSDSPYRPLLEYFESPSIGELASGSGTAIKAFIWNGCKIDGCNVNAAEGMNVLLWRGGSAVKNTVSAKRGQLAFWLQDAEWSGNSLRCEDLGMAFSGSYCARIKSNHINARTGLANVSPAEWLRKLDLFLAETVAAYNVAVKRVEETDGGHEIMALWMVLEEVCDGLGLAGLRDSVQALLDTFKNFKGLPASLLAGIYISGRLKTIVAVSKKIPMPVISLEVSDNRIEAETGIQLEGFIPMGGFSISNNHVQTLTGRALRIKAHPYTVNPYVIMIGWRLSYEMLPSSFRAIAQAMASSDAVTNLTDSQKEAVGKILGQMDAMYKRLNSIIEPILKADYRIESNSIRSSYTALESNLFELAVQNNHVTMEESELSNKESVDIVDILDKYAATKDLAAAMRQRSAAQMRSYTDEASKTSSTKEAQADLTKASSEINKTAVKGDLKKATANLSHAASEADVDQINKSLTTVVEILESYVDTCGIWIKGAGCRVVGNQVVVPLDADPESWAQGGIRFWDDEGSPIWLIAFLEEMLQLIRPDVEIPSMLGATETLIDNNEIVRGVGNGVEINGIANMLLGLGLIDVKIRGNQIRDMAGAGISFDEKSLTIGADIEGNRILDCGSSNIEGSLVDERGGIVVRNTAGCRLHNNRVRCTSNLGKKVGLFAVDLQKIYGLSLTDNYLEHSEVSGYNAEQISKYLSRFESNTGRTMLVLENLCGVIRLSELSSEAVIHNNEILLSRGIGSGLVLGRVDTGDIGGLWHTGELMVLPEHYSMAARSVAMETGADVPALTLTATASVQGNHFATAAAMPFFAFLIAGVQDLNFSGNNICTKATGLCPGYVIGVNRGLVNNNMLDVAAILMGSGVFTGNTSNQSVTLPSGVKSGVNDPPTT